MGNEKVKGKMKGQTIKSGNKRPTKSGAGMTAKGVAKYRRDNPGSKLKTAVTGTVKVVLLQIDVSLLCKISWANETIS